MWNWYERYFKEKLFNKIIFMYSINSVISLLALAFIISCHITTTLKQEEMVANQQTLENIRVYFDGKYQASQRFMQQIYMDQLISGDVMYFLKHDYVKYLHYRLDDYYESSTTFRKNINTYLESCLSQEESLENIALASYANQTVYGLTRSSGYQYYKMKAPIRWRCLICSKSLFSEKFDPLLEKKDVYTFVSEIKDPSSLQPLGILSVEYSLEGIRQSYESQYTKIRGKVLILTKDGRVIFDSTGEEQTQEYYPYFHQLKEEPEEINLDNKVYLVNILQSSSTKSLIVGLIPKSEILENTSWHRQTIWGGAFTLIVGAILISYISISSFSERTQQITEAMSELKSGDLSVRIPIDSKEDELTAIAQNFNQMCEDLNTYIDQVYLLEIHQKQAELRVLQAQINPHFLYNTLEVIRMRAIAQGVEDVGQMIYILSNLFKHSIKDEMLTTVAAEVEHCRLYLELFQIRYRDRLTVSIDISPELMTYPMIKLSLQPIVENYIIHGIRLEKKDNHIRIQAYLQEQDIIFKIIDNGYGISPQILEQVVDKLKEPTQKLSGIGLSNVNARLKMLYGEEYGLIIDSKVGEGTTVTINMKAQKEGVEIECIQCS
ncbi:MAG: sensor histidine kinase [Epulopiscium sp.]|nr:sensor histidine kinase [Candidatus Epulonipiscium sp.]